MSLPQPWVFFPANDQVVTFGPVILGSTQFSAPPTYVTDCTGTFTLLDPTGNAVTGANGLTFTFVPSSNGLYTAQIFGSTFNPTVLSAGYTSVITLTSIAQSAQNVWSVPSIVKKRNSS
jgi:hypothetical protein